MNLSELNTREKNVLINLTERYRDTTKGMIQNLKQLSKDQNGNVEWAITSLEKLEFDLMEANGILKKLSGQNNNTFNFATRE